MPKQPIPRQVEFFFDIVSPASYLAWTQMPGLAKETGAKIIFRPFFLPGLFKEAGSDTPIRVPAKRKWLFDDLGRWAKRYGVPFNMNPHFPLNSLWVMRGLIAWADKPELVALGDGFFEAMWVNGEDLNDPAVVDRVLAKAGVNGEEYRAAIADPETKQKVFDISSDLAKRGAFGAPTFFVGDEMFWGQDRLDFIRQALGV